MDVKSSAKLIVRLSEASPHGSEPIEEKINSITPFSLSAGLAI